MPGSYSARFVRGPDAITLADLLPGTQSAITSLTHTALTGTVDNTLADISTVDAALEADLKDLASKVNEILVVLRAYGMIAP